MADLVPTFTEVDGDTPIPCVFEERETNGGKSAWWCLPHQAWVANSCDDEKTGKRKPYSCRMAAATALHNKAKPICAESVRPRSDGLWASSRPCGRKAKVILANGVYRCWQHDPREEMRRVEERRAKSKAEDLSWRRRSTVQSAGPRLAAAFQVLLDTAGVDGLTDLGLTREQAAAVVAYRILAKYESKSSPGTYHQVRKGLDGVTYCTCPAFQFRGFQGGTPCSHLTKFKAGKGRVSDATWYDDDAISGMPKRRLDLG